MQLILPINITFKEWACQMRVAVPELNLPIPPPIEFWRDWAAQLVRGRSLDGVPLPTTLGFPDEEDWKKWGAYFINSLYNQI